MRKKARTDVVANRPVELQGRIATSEGVGEGAVLTSDAPDHSIRWRPGERLERLFEDRCDQLRIQGLGTRLAVDAGDVRLTYKHLDEHANQLARHLLVLGARPGDRIALLFDQPWRAYAAMLAVLKIGAAYVPMDPAFPSDRLKYIVEDADAAMVLSLTHLKDLLPEVAAPVMCLDHEHLHIAGCESSRLTDLSDWGTPTELAYIIYTSGSTGRPKGVAVDHASICNFVRVASDVYGIRSSDRVYQGMTLAFDFSVEEIWVPWLAGATLVPKPGGSSLLGAELSAFLTQKQITALCCVPTLLATIEEELPDLRFLLVSGEACPRDLIVRWHRPGLRFLNVYGPTEATVTATWNVVDPDRPVTLGVPLPTYTAVILDPEENRALGPGETGEIGLAGVGLARGYVNRDDLTEKAFIPDFLGIENNPSARIYRTGDLGRINAEGEIEYFGRIDTQVKIRGYRIELTEIESVLLKAPGVAQAVVGTYEPAPGFVELVAYYTVRHDTADPDEQKIHEMLRKLLPGYMVPAYFERLEAIPMMASDKADRKKLPAPTNRRSLTGPDSYTAPAAGTEEALATQLGAVLGLERVSAEANFFEDLGANSLLLAHFSARVRKHTGLPPIAMQDVYQSPTVRQLAVVLDAAQSAADLEPAASTPPAAVPAGPLPGTGSFVLCGAIQLLIFLGYTTYAAFLLVFGFTWVSEGTSVIDMWVRSVGFGAVMFVALSIAPIMMKWILVGRWKPAEIPLWSMTYIRFWAVKTLTRANPLVMFVGSPLYILYLRALGAKIGKNVVIFSRTVPVCTDLITIGADTVIHKNSFFLGYRARSGAIETGPVTLGRNVLISEKTTLDIGSSMGDNTQLGHASSLQSSQSVPDGQTWHGSPAVPTNANYRTVEPASCTTRRRVIYSLLQLFNRFVLVVPAGLIGLAMLLPDYLESQHLQLDNPRFYLDVLASTVVLFATGLLTGLVIAFTVPRLLNLALKPDTVYPLYGVHFTIQRMIAGMTNVKLYRDIFGDSSYIVYFLQALGYDLGKVEQTGSNFGPEVAHETPYLSSVGSGTMVSDGLNIMNADFSSSSFRVSRVTIGERNFLGNDITFPLAARTGDNCLLATKVMVPIDGPIREGVGLLGSPPFEIPRIVDRDKEFDELKNEEIRKPLIKAKNKHNIVTMGLFLFVRWFLFFEATLLAAIAVTFYDDFGALAVGVATLAFLVVGILISVVAERSVLGFGRLKPQYCSIYDPYFWHHERLWKLLAVAPFSGTPFKSMIWRLLGVRVGKRLYDAGCDIPEKTLVSIGDDCALNEGTAIQSHSMEDGTFKSDYITLRDRCSLGVASFVNYAVTMRNGSTLLADSFLMKGGEVPENAVYGANPAREIRDSSVYLPSPVTLPRIPRHRAIRRMGLGRPTRDHRTNPGKHEGIPA
ncbi:amino acid adenylation domain-containing protein [Arthrobacter sp. SF27]|nr:Pls/PosA family non-ribosomal peptide synthetase [Arthrobacter sp. SF27]NMR31190.1 amino acid adenylation domain-containing protein [Arthrobacter sp. SF27]